MARSALRRRGRGASWPANPYSFVGRHHAARLVRPFGAADVVLQDPQILIPSSGGTTSLSPSEPPASRTWCFMTRKSLFLRREAPRPWTHPGLRRRVRGAPRSANPYSFVRKHHVPESVRASGATDVVLQGQQILIPSSGSTTSLSPSGPSAPWTWCSMTRKSLFLRREAPRPWTHPGLRRLGRGAPWPANPYSFVGKHHVPVSVRISRASAVRPQLFNLFIHISL